MYKHAGTQVSCGSGCVWSLSFSNQIEEMENSFWTFVAYLKKQDLDPPVKND